LDFRVDRRLFMSVVVPVVVDENFSSVVVFSYPSLYLSSLIEISRRLSSFHIRRRDPF
jgi:hypothetical protein